jgi:hypothetical protein
MRLWLVLVLGVQIFSLTSANAAPWVKYTDPSGRFSVMFPNAPEIKPTVQTPAFEPGAKTFPLSAYGAREDGDKAFLMVFDTDLTGVDVDAEKILDAQQSHLLQGVTNGIAKAVALNGVACRHLSYTASDGSDRSIITIFFLGTHLYQVIAVISATASAQDIEDAQRFSDSLHFER